MTSRCPVTIALMMASIAVAIGSNLGEKYEPLLETLSIADNATLSTGDINYTWSAWAWTDSLGTVARPILAKWASSPNGEYLLILNADNTVQFFIANGAANNNVTASQTITATETWHLFIAWHDAGANEICLQIDDSTPDCAARPVATMIDIGVASPSAQGQAMISTATALISPNTQLGSGPTRPQAMKVATAMATTAITNQPAT